MYPMNLRITGFPSGQVTKLIKIFLLMDFRSFQLIRLNTFRLCVGSAVLLISMILPAKSSYAQDSILSKAEYRLENQIFENSFYKVQLYGTVIDELQHPISINFQEVPRM